MTDYLITKLTEIANHPNVIKTLESHVAFPLKVETWQTRRILYAVMLIWDEIQKDKLASGENIPCGRD